MSESKTAATQKVEQFYAALNGNHLDEALALFHPDITRVEFGASPLHGHTELSKNFSDGRSTWAEGGCKPESYIISGDKIIADVHVRVRLKDKTDWIDGRVADAFRIADGKIIEFHSFFKTEQALEWAAGTT